MARVLALGFDLFFRPKLAQAAQSAGVDVGHAAPSQAVEAAKHADRVVADVSAPGVHDALVAIRQARPDVPILACYPHVEEARAQAVRALGGVAIPRGAFVARLEDALTGKLGPER